MNETSTRADLESKLLQETSQIPWRELQTYYAKGQVIQVSDKLDLIKVAAELASDNVERVKAWMADTLVGEVSPTQAQAWYDNESTLWAVVVMPWVLVQYRPETPAQNRPFA